MLDLKKYDLRAHVIALSIAIFGPLFNLFLRPIYMPFVPSVYIYWLLVLLIYIAVLVPFTRKQPLILLRLVILGITVEDFASKTWRFLFGSGEFLPFVNWYTQYFPFLGSLGEPTPYILIPQWYLLALSLYLILTVIQYRKNLVGLAKK
jgi:hypothetical protein